MRWNLYACQLSPVNLCDRPPPSDLKCDRECHIETSSGGSATECRYSQAGNYRCSTKTIPARRIRVCRQYCR